MYKLGDDPSHATVRAHHFRIHGSIKESEIVFDLDIGEYRVGTSSTSEIRLPVTGVSRQHALLIARLDGLVVEDRGSRNGTFIDGVRVDRAVVPVGAEIRFGPASLHVTAIDREDRELAVVSSHADSSVARPLSSAPLDRTSRIPPTEDLNDSDAWLTVIDGFVERLAAPGQGTLSHALGAILRGLDLVGVCVVDWRSDSEPTLVASAGLLREVPDYEAVAELWNESAAAAPPDRSDLSEGPVPQVAFFATRPALSLALKGPAQTSPTSADHLRAQRDALAPNAVVRDRVVRHAATRDTAIRGLLGWGEHELRHDGIPLWRTLLGLIEATFPRSRAEAVSVRRTVPELVFPSGYRPLSAPPMQHLYDQIRRLLHGDLPTLILGETGVGKERIAQILHESSDRREAPFIALNCAALPAELLEAELFGIAKGVATGVQKRRGQFQRADGGTLFLDEIGELATPLQAKLLRALQEKEIHPLGGTPKAIDVRVLAATNADLTDKIDSGVFRRDLYYRLSGFVLEIPPLRLCREDIPALVEHFLHRFTRRAAKGIRGLSVKAMRRLASHPWPGNIRELKHAVRGLVYQCPEGRTIESEAVRNLVTTAGDRPTIPLDPLLLDERILELETVLVREALRRSNGNRTEAARLLGISRNGLAKKLKRLGITISKIDSQAR